MELNSKTWVQHPVTLQGKRICLMPLENEDVSGLYNIGANKKLWEFGVIDYSNEEKFKKAYHKAIIDREQGTQYPFVIFHIQENRFIGSTRLFDIEPKHRKLEVGWTWLVQEFWGSGINRECKFLLLSHCFEVLKTERVQFKTDEKNVRSRIALDRIGAKMEGILRKDKIKEDGNSRNTVYYSIISEEWQSVKKKLIMLDQMNDNG
jgi:RimJ/RimL family protein N-acetyltransferase